MGTPQRPLNPRVVYPDGSTIPILKVWYGQRILDTYVWVSEEPQFVTWKPGARIEYDNNEPYCIVIGWDVTDNGDLPEDEQ